MSGILIFAFVLLFIGTLFVLGPVFLVLGEVAFTLFAIFLIIKIIDFFSKTF